MALDLKKLIFAQIATLSAILLLGMGIGSTDNMPAYAVVFVDDATHEYIAPQCTEAWRAEPKGFNVLRRTIAGEAFRLKYKQNDICNESGAFHPDGYQLTPLVLWKVGLLPKKKQWWDMPYRTESGVIYPPDTEPKAQ